MMRGLKAYSGKGGSWG